MSHVDSCLRLHIRPWGRGRQLLVDFIKTKQENIAVVSQFPSPRTENSERTQKCGPGGHAGGDTPPPKGRPDSVLASRPVQHKTSWSAGCCWCRGTAGTCPRPPRGLAGLWPPHEALASHRVDSAPGQRQGPLAEDRGAAGLQGAASHQGGLQFRLTGRESRAELPLGSVDDVKHEAYAHDDLRGKEKSTLPLHTGGGEAGLADAWRRSVSHGVLLRHAQARLLHRPHTAVISSVLGCRWECAQVSGQHRASTRPRCPRHGGWLDASHTCPLD